MATKDGELAKSTNKLVTEKQPEPQIVGPIVVQTEKPTNNQTALTIAIISAVALFFVGFGLGYLLGHSTNERVKLPTNGTQIPRGDGGRRFYPNSDTDTTTEGTDSDTNTKTQTN